MTLMSTAGKYERLLQSPFDYDIEKLPLEHQLEVNDLQCNDALRDKFKEGNLINFYKLSPRGKLRKSEKLCPWFYFCVN
jgi:hypothetical protein